MMKKLISIILCVVMLVTASAVPASAAVIRKPVGIVSAIRNGYPMTDLGDVLKGIYQINKLVNFITGVPIFTEEQLVVTVDDMVRDVVDDIKVRKGVDFSNIYTMLPSVNRSAEMITSTFHINIPVLRRELERAASQLREKDQPTMAGVVDLLKIWLSIVDELQIQLNPTGESGVYRFDILITYRDGSHDVFESYIYYDYNTNEIRGEGDTPALLGFNVNMDQVYSYTGVNVWQRKFGFCVEYDLFCFLTPYIMNYVTERIKFVYDNREWMCQIWKGMYFITNGGEVGFYTRPLGSIGTFYNCIDDDDMLVMSLDIYHKDKLLLSRAPVKHWWVTGFEVDSVCYVPATLTLVTTITMKDEDMLNSFTKALKKKKLVLDYEVNGLDVTITW